MRRKIIYQGDFCGRAAHVEGQDLAQIIFPGDLPGLA